MLERARFDHGRRSGRCEQIIQLCKTSFGAFYKFFGGIDPTSADILACPHLTLLQKLKLLLDAGLLLLAPGYETIRRSHYALLALLLFLRDNAQLGRVVAFAGAEPFRLRSRSFAGSEVHQRVPRHTTQIYRMIVFSYDAGAIPSLRSAASAVPLQDRAARPRNLSAPAIEPLKV